MKKLLATLLVALFCIGLIGCGVPQEEYAKVVGERDELAAGQIDLESQLEKTSAELDALSQKLEELEAENQKLSGDLTTANQTIQDLSSKITDLENQLSQKTAEAAQLSSEKSTSSSKNRTSSDNSFLLYTSRACSFCVERPISAPKPNSEPSVNRVLAFTYTAALSTSSLNFSALR